MIDNRIIEQILDRSNIVDIIGSYIELKPKGNRWTACCPFHNEKTPSFFVEPARGTWHCFGCGKGGNVISFVMEHEGMSYPEAVKTLAKKYGITVEEIKLTPEQERDQKRKEAMMIVNAKAEDWFVEQIKLPQNKAAMEYAVSRWGEKYVQEMGIGFAPDGWHNMESLAEKESLSMEILKECSLLRENDKGYYDFYRNRITIPIRDRYRRVIGFTARDLSGIDGTAKYLNSAESDIYSKGNSLFGIDVAIRQAVKQGKFYAVEGAPDVMRLQEIGVNNTLASLGSSWTKEQFESIRKYASSICFLPDADPPKQGEPYGTGIKAVIRNGKLAMECGYSVSVKEIPLTEDRSKNDPDSYCTSMARFDMLEEEDYITWYARYLFAGSQTTQQRSEAMNAICTLIAMVKDEVKEEMYVNQLQEIYKGKGLWSTAIRQAKKLIEAKKLLNETRKIDRDLYAKYGFYEEHNAYYAISSQGGNPVQWSNFSMIPMFHIKDAIMPKRLYKIKNTNKQEEIIEMKQEDLSSLAKFKLKVEGLGNYIWLVTEKELTKLKMFLYEQTETAVEITQLGWQKKGFFAFGNGCFDTEWHPVDEYGIVRLQQGNYYLPAQSKIYADENNLFQFERKFVHTNFSNVRLYDFATKLIEVFGDNAKIGLCFLLATLFRDIIAGYTKSFPILNLFGPKGSGKSEMGDSLMSLFIIKNKAPNIQNSTIAALSDTVAQCANALVHLDEYKNTIDIDKREFLKGLWDGSGRSRMNMDRDKKREITNVDCGVIISGQEMPTIDIALFSRLIYLTFNRTEFTKKEKKTFDELREMRNLGLSHLTLELLRFRPIMEAEFINSYNQCMNDLNEKLDSASIEDRIFRNWVIPLAAFRTLDGLIQLPMNYEEVKEISIKGIIKQNNECKRTNELANFWGVVSFLLQQGEIYNLCDIRIDYVKQLKTDITSTGIEFPEHKPILMMRISRIFMLYKKNARQTGDNAIPTESLKFYLEHSKEYLGKKNSVRFKNVINGTEVIKTFRDPNGVQSTKPMSTVDQAMCFDYEMIKSIYEVNLEIDMPDQPDDEENKDTEKRNKTFQF